ncbi:MAG TPA: HAD-IC family P-type ATPase [Roseiflexaceae bacterium]|nr:HAD-IC family P-type ATPase [Roseiflexaceae bacterium]
MQLIQGLTQQEVRARQERGETNAASFRSSRSYWDIVRANLFNFFNNILFAIGVALIALGQYNDAFTSVGQGLVNALIGTVQEINAKRKLDKIALLARSRVRVLRDGHEQEIDPAGLVKGDVVHVQAGDQIVVDGRVVGEGRLEMDESLLTGEPDMVVKQDGDTLLSGSFCVTGDAYYQAEKVGAESFANQLTETVRAFQAIQTPLQQQITFAVRLVTFIVALMSGVILLQTVLEDFPLIRIVQISAVLSGQVPYGLFFLVALAYAVGAAGIARRGALVQQTNAVESLSNVDVLCMDKTGTLTANRLVFHAIHPLANIDEANVRVRLGTFARSASTGNATSEALAAALPAEQQQPADEIPFASARKWSALAFDEGAQRGVYTLGAVEMLAPYLPSGTMAEGGPVAQQVAEWSDRGLRVLLFAANPDVTSLHDAEDQPQLPPVTPLALVALSDELRPRAKETIAAFADLGIQLKIISGDNPQTVAALAKQAGLPANLRMATGPDLAQMAPALFDQVVAETTVFGRIAPEQKEQIVASLIQQGNYVAMMGDGVNDALSLKKAKLGIAMESGSNVTRNVADMILLNDSFAALLPALTEGKRIVGGLSISLYLFLTRVITSMLIIIAISMIGLGFPYEPSQVALTLFTVGLPTLFLTWWARPETPKPDLLRRLLRFVLPAAVITMIFGVGIYTFFYEFVLQGITSYHIPPDAAARWEAYTGLQYQVDAEFGAAAATIVAQTALSTFIAFASFGLILFLEPPSRLFTGWAPVSPDKRPALLALALSIIYVVVLVTPVTANYFGLVTPGWRGPELRVLLVTLPLWFLILRTIWRAKLFDRLLTVGESS